MSTHERSSFFDDFIEMTKEKLHQAAEAANEFVHVCVTADNIPCALPALKEDGGAYVDRYSKHMPQANNQKAITTASFHDHKPQHNRHGQKTIPH